MDIQRTTCIQYGQLSWAGTICYARDIVPRATNSFGIRDTNQIAGAQCEICKYL